LQLAARQQQVSQLKDACSKQEKALKSLDILNDELQRSIKLKERTIGEFEAELKCERERVKSFHAELQKVTTESRRAEEL